MLAAIAGILFVISAVLWWAGHGDYGTASILVALVAAAVFCFHFVFSYYVTTYRR